MISGSNEQLQQQLEYTLLKLDCHSLWISKMQSGREDTLEERYAIKFYFKIGKKCHRNEWNASDCFSTILHESIISFWDSRKAGNLWGMRRGVGGLGNKRTSGDHPNYSIIEIDQITEKSPGDLKRLAVTQTQVRNHPLNPLWKSLK